MCDEAVTIANDQTLVELIRSAQVRLVVLAPAITKPVAVAVVERWQALGSDRVSVILDVDAEVYRLGYGDIEALRALEEIAGRLGGMVNRHKGIRVGMVVADDQTMVYSPTPRLIEAGPRKSDAPNAIRLGTTPVKVERELGLGLGGVRDRRIGQDKATKDEIETVSNDLKANPPQKFDVARKMRVFNSLIEFVEFTLTGTMLQRHKAKLPPDLLGIAEGDATRELLDTQFRLIGKDSELSGDELQSIKGDIVSEYLTLLPRYGYVIERTNKAAFEKRIEEFKEEVEAFASYAEKKLEAEMQANRERVIEVLLPAVKASPPKAWKWHLSNGPEDVKYRELLDAALKRAFGNAKRHIRAMRVKVVFKGVTHESLTDPEFAVVALERLSHLKQLHEESDVVEGTEDNASEESSE